MKSCQQCDLPKVSNPNPRARVCADCKRQSENERRQAQRAASRGTPPGKCWVCKTTDLPEGHRVCDGCRVTGARVHRVCKRCNGPFTTTTAQTVCPRCYHKARKHPCIECGAMVDGRAVRCLTCNGATRRTQGAVIWRHGYRHVKVHDHPHADKQNYIREHRLVMEEMLGRYLTPDETVHHVNGDRADNRPANLELWVRTQPSGQRVEDLVAWAHEILARYEAEVAARNTTGG